MAECSGGSGMVMFVPGRSGRPPSMRMVCSGGPPSHLARMPRPAFGIAGDWQGFRGIEGQHQKRVTTGQSAWQPGGLPMNPRWRCPDVKPWLRTPLCRMGPPPRSFADDAHDCIMVAIRTRIDRIQGCGATFCAPMASSPRIRPCRSSSCKTTHVGERRTPTIAIHGASNSAE